MQHRAVILGVGELPERLAGRPLPEPQLLVVVTGGNIDDDGDQPAEVCHRINIRPGSHGPYKVRAAPPDLRGTLVRDTIAGREPSEGWQFPAPYWK